MACALLFLPSALKEWRRLDGPIREQLKKKLAERLEAPDVAAARLHGSANRYKIKLRASGFRLVYALDAEQATVTVIAVGRRDSGAVYDAASRREG